MRLFLQKEVLHAGLTFYVKTGFLTITLMTGNSWFLIVYHSVQNVAKKNDFYLEKKSEYAL